MGDAPTVHDAGSHLFPRKGSSGSGTYRLYTVEVRYDYPESKAWGDFIIDREWRTLPIIKWNVGVPNKTFSRHAEDHGLLSWPAANALRWWAHAAMGWCVQTRIVAHEFEESYSETIIGYHDVIGGGGSDARTRLTHSPASAPLTEPVTLHRPSNT